ncbi:MAG: hypothetical protein R2710_23425 [Acidimicrobiales bacterium]
MNLTTCATRSSRCVTHRQLFGVNIAQAFVRDPNIVQFVIDQASSSVSSPRPAIRRRTPHN